MRFLCGSGSNLVVLVVGGGGEGNPLDFIFPCLFLSKLGSLWQIPLEWS